MATSRDQIDPRKLKKPRTGNNDGNSDDEDDSEEEDDDAALFQQPMAATQSAQNVDGEGGQLARIDGNAGAVKSEEEAVQQSDDDARTERLNQTATLKQSPIRRFGEQEEEKHQANNQIFRVE